MKKMHFQGPGSFAGSVFAMVLMMNSAALASSPTYQLVADVDDTLKVSQIENKPMAGINGLFTSKELSGSSEYFQAAFDQGARTNFLSATPKWLRTKIWRFIKKHQFPQTRIFLKDKMSDDTRTYKLDRLKKIAAESPVPLVLVSDDTEIDPEVFSEFADQNPGRVAAIYIRRNLNRRLPANCISFTTIFEVAMLEEQAGRLKASQLPKIALSILKDKHRRVLPRHSSCAVTETRIAKTAEIQVLENLVNDRVTEICKNYYHKY